MDVVQDEAKVSPMLNMLNLRRCECHRHRSGHADKAAVVEQDKAEIAVVEQKEAETAVADLELKGKVAADCT